MEYEALLEEKKASSPNKARAQQRSIDMSEFANLKALTKAEEEDDNPLGVRARGKQGWQQHSGRLAELSSDGVIVMTL